MNSSDHQPNSSGITTGQRAAAADCAAPSIGTLHLAQLARSQGSPRLDWSYRLDLLKSRFCEGKIIHGSWMLSEGCSCTPKRCLGHGEMILGAQRGGEYFILVPQVLCTLWSRLTFSVYI